MSHKEAEKGEAAAAGGGKEGPPRSPSSSSSASSSSSCGDVQQFKVVVLGDGAVGKTSILMRFCQEYFARQYKQTIGLDFFTKELVLPGGTRVSLQLWDIGGQSIGSRMIGNYVYGADAVLCCYDLTSYASFQSVEDWHEMVAKTFDGAPRPLTALVANKTDLNHLRAVSDERHAELAAREGANMVSYFVSALSGDNVGIMFTHLAATLAGVELTHADVKSAAQVVEAKIVNHPRNDPDTAPANVAALGKRSKKCVVM